VKVKRLKGTAMPRKKTRKPLFIARAILLGLVVVVALA